MICANEYDHYYLQDGTLMIDDSIKSYALPLMSNALNTIDKKKQRYISLNFVEFPILSDTEIQVILYKMSKVKITWMTSYNKSRYLETEVKHMKNIMNIAKPFNIESANRYLYVVLLNQSSSYIHATEIFKNIPLHYYNDTYDPYLQLYYKMWLNKIFNPFVSSELLNKFYFEDCIQNSVQRRLTGEKRVICTRKRIRRRRKKRKGIL